MKRILAFLFLFIFLFSLSITNVSAEYLVFRNNFKRTGTSNYSISGPLDKITNYPIISLIRSDPIVDNSGNTYFSLWNYGLQVFDKNRNLLWKINNNLFGPPAIDNSGNLYFCSGPLVYSFDKSGQKRWEHNFTPPNSRYTANCFSSPAMSPNKDTLYVTVDWPIQSIRAFNLDGTIKWESRIWYTPFTASIAVADDGTLYVGTSSGYGIIFAINSNGIIKWSSVGVGVITNTPVVGDDGNIYASFQDNNSYGIASFSSSGALRWKYYSIIVSVKEISFKNNTVYATGKNQVIALDAATGLVKWIWTITYNYGSIQNITVDNNGNSFVAVDDTIYAISPSGQTIWSKKLSKYLQYITILDNDKLLITQTNSGQYSYYILEKNIPTKTPVVFIPGIGGSELKTINTVLWSFPDGHGGTYNHTYPAGEKVWVNEGEAINPGNDDYFDILRMNSDGLTSVANLDITGNMFAGSYQGTIDFLTSAGYTLNKDLFIFPYDWRRDIATTAPLLDQKIESIKTQTGSQKVDIIAHSLGGLVARNYINDPTKAEKVRKLINLGTPHLGAVEFLKNLNYGGCLSKVNLEPFCIGISSSEVKDVIQNMISGYELAPSQKYYEFYNGSDNNHPLPFVKNTGFLNYSQLKTMLANLNYNTALFTPSESFHNLDNNLNNTNGVDVSIIAGSGKATTSQIIEDYSLNFAGIKIPKTDIRKVNGDDTVPLFSASLTDGTKSIAGSAKIYYTNQKHSDLVFNGSSSLNLVKNILSGDNNLPSGIATQPFNFSGTALSVHSPVLIHAYDQNGKHTGPLSNGDYEINIPGSSYEVLGDAKFIWLPDNGVYTLNFEATDQGSFDFKIRNYKDDVNDKTILYKDVPLTSSTKAETAFDTNSQIPPTLKIDQDGNGTVDLNVEKFSVLTGDANFDHTPPQISFDVSPKIIWPPNNKMVDINITGNIRDQNPYQTIIKVEDEYGLIEPSITLLNQTNINQIIKLEASRKGDDLDGRKYVVKILATDKAGNTSLETKEVLVPHDQGKK